MKSVRLEILMGVAAVVAGLILPMAVQAETAAAQKPGKGFHRLDINGDGKVSPEELKAAQDSRFKAEDTNGDGSISKDEMLADARKKAEDRVERVFKKVDTNADGKISRAEYDAAGAKMRERMKDRREHKDKTEQPSGAPK